MILWLLLIKHDYPIQSVVKVRRLKLQVIITTPCYNWPLVTYGYQIEAIPVVHVLITSNWYKLCYNWCLHVVVVFLCYCFVGRSCLLGGYNKDVVNCNIEFIVKPAIPMFANICKVFFVCATQIALNSLIVHTHYLAGHVMDSETDSIL